MESVRHVFIIVLPRSWCEFYCDLGICDRYGLVKLGHIGGLLYCSGISA